MFKYSSILPFVEKRPVSNINGSKLGLPWYENRIMACVRMDKWLWAARFFKTRSLAARACELGRIEANGQQAKRSREIRVGDLLQVKNDGGEFLVEVLLLSEIRGPAVIAQTLYRETAASRESRLKLAEGEERCHTTKRRGKANRRSAIAVN